ncbi:MAG: hypothetical protein PUE13_05420 [Clostridiales bacterium]|nr:hypothetical protein [Clostridiales bacterium]
MSNNNSGEERSKIRSWAAGVLNEIKAAFGINSPSTVMRDQVGKYLALGVAEGLYENDKAVVLQFTAMLEKLKYQRDFDIISEDEYYRRLESLRDRYFSVGTQQWVKYTEQIYAYQKEVLEQERTNIREMYDDITEYAEARMNDVIKKQQRYSEELKATGGLFDVNTLTVNGTRYSYYSMHDLDRDIKNIQAYGDMLEKIRARGERLGLDGGLINNFLSQVKSLNLEDASGLMKALELSDDKRFSAYIDAWQRKNDTAESLSAREYKQEFDESVEDSYKNMCERLKQAGYEIPDGFYVSGSISAQNFGNAFIEELDRQLEQVRAKVADFNSRLAAEVSLDGGVNSVVYNNQTAYNINAANGADTVEQIRRYETVKRLSGV